MAARSITAYAKHPGKISRVEPLIGRSGWLTLRAFGVESLGQSEDHLIFAAATDEGEPLDPETAARLMTLPGTVSPLAPDAGPGARQEQFAVQIADQRGTIERGISERNARIDGRHECDMSLSPACSRRYFVGRGFRSG